ncbi:MAG: arsenosugar biosynthesis radical SAM protein ArsS [Bdellovibrionales bacterium]|nr:arsenosugar biosynthesis radical SAM protein ArsS [Bdellovibrionales bacterium]
MKSLLSRGSPLDDSAAQLKAIGEFSELLRGLPRFREKLASHGMNPLHPARTEIFQVNAGKMCNQTCRHCHVDAGPDRREIMTRETFEACLKVIAATEIPTVDLTGGAPEMNPHFRWFVEEVTRLGRKTMVRCNLTIILANERFRDLPEFFARNRVHVVSSLPYFEKAHTDRQRGDQVFEKSIEALKLLNAQGYGREGSGLPLDLVYNPSGAFLPGAQASLETEFKKALQSRYGITFNALYTITNMPISRFLEYLQNSGNLDDYMERLVNAYNPAAAAGVMCRNTISVGWDGKLYDCDFNQMLDIPVASQGSKTVFDFDARALGSRSIAVDQHCYGCTAGAGSSCGGATV